MAREDEEEWRGNREDAHGQVLEWEVVQEGGLGGTSGKWVEMRCWPELCLSAREARSLDNWGWLEGHIQMTSGTLHDEGWAMSNDER